MTALALISATALADGRTVQLVFQAPDATTSGAPDWLSGYKAGLRLTTDTGKELEEIGNYVTASATNLTWTATYLVDDAADTVTFGRTGLTVSAGAGLLQDGVGASTAGFSSFAVTNNSLVDVSGFTTQSFTLGTGGVNLYVSSSHGNDSRTFIQAENPATPYKTLAVALQQAFQNGMGGKGASVNLLRGDTFTAGSAIKTSGQDARHPFIIQDYWYDFGGGTTDPGTRPVVAIDEHATTNSSVFSTSGGGGTPATVNNVLLRRLDIEAVNWTGDINGRYGLSFYRGGTGWTVDDCVISNFGFNVVFQGIDGPFRNVTLLRDIITDSRYDNSVISAHSSGVYLSNVQGALISQCTIDDNGRVSADRSGRDIFSHNVYIQSDCGPAVVWGNVIRAGGSNGVQMRSGGVLAYNYFGRNAIAAFIDGPGGTQFKNVVEKAEDISPTLPRGFGLTMNSDYANSIAQEIESNILVNFAGSQDRAITLDQVHGNGISHAIVRNNTEVKAGSFEFNSPNNTPLFQSVVNVGNLIDGGPYHAYVAPAFTSWSWYQADGNDVVSSLPVSQVTQLGVPVLSLANWGAATGGTETNSISVVPQFADATFDIGSFYKGVGGTKSEADYVASLRGRAAGVWGTPFDVSAVFKAFAAAYTPTNLPSPGQGVSDYYGAADYRVPLGSITGQTSSASFLPNTDTTGAGTSAFNDDDLIASLDDLTAGQNGASTDLHLKKDPTRHG